jgi:hypothetical protein
MGSMVPSLAAGAPSRWRRVALGYIGLSTLGLAGSLILAWLPFLGVQSGPSPLPEALPLLTAFLGLFAGALCLVLVRGTAAASDAEATLSSQPPAAFSGLQVVVHELNGVLTEERDKAAAFQEVFTAAMREVRVVSARVARLTEAAMDAETRLGASVADADAALRQPSQDSDRQIQNALPELADMIRRGIAEQSQAITARLDAAAGQLTAEASGPLQTFRSALLEAVDHIKALGNNAVLLRRDVTALDAVGRETAVANAKIVARVGSAIAQIDAAVAYLPAAAAAVTAAVEQAAQTLAGASIELRADGAALEASRTDTRQAATAIQFAAEALTASAQEFETAGSRVMSQLGDTIDGINDAVQTLTDAPRTQPAEPQGAGETPAASADTTQAAAAIQLAAEALTATARDLDSAGSRLGETIADVTAALAGLPAAAATVTAAGATVAHNLAEASAALCADAAALAKCGQDAQQATAALGVEAEALKATGSALADTGHRTLATVAKAAEMAVAELAAQVSEASADRNSLTSFTAQTATLENIAATLVDSAYRLDEAGQRSAAAGEWVATRLDMNTARSEALLQALPDVAADMTAAASGLRHETSVLTAAAQQMSAAGNAAVSAVTDITARAEASVASLDTAGRIISTVEIQIDRLAAVAGQAEAQASLLPDAAGSVTAAADRLQAAAEAWQPAPMHVDLPEVAARIEAAASTLDRLDTMSSRLEAIVRGLPPEQDQAETLTAIAGLSADIAVSVRRVEAALSEHEAAWPSVAASIAQVEAAALAVAEAAEHAAPGSPRGSFLPATFDAETAPAAVIATLRHFDEVACQSEMLLQQAEALAEAVLAGRAPGLPPLLADRTPALLAELDATTRRLRSVATALALASDGTAISERRLA